CPPARTWPGRKRSGSLADGLGNNTQKIGSAAEAPRRNMAGTAQPGFRMKLRASLKGSLPLPLQPASAAIAQAKYFQPGEDLDGLRRRLARALAAAEADSGRWEEAFHGVLHHAWPGGRIMANAGAEDFRPGVSTI